MNRRVVPVLGVAWMMALLLGGCKTLQTPDWLPSTPWMSDATAEKAKNPTPGPDSEPVPATSKKVKAPTGEETAERTAAAIDDQTPEPPVAEEMVSRAPQEPMMDGPEMETPPIDEEPPLAETAAAMDEAGAEPEPVADGDAVATAESAATDATEKPNEQPLEMTVTAGGQVKAQSPKPTGTLAKCVATKTAGTLDPRSTDDRARVISEVEDIGTFRIDIEKNDGGSLVVVTSPPEGDNREILAAIEYCSRRKVERKGGWPLM